MTKKLRLPKIFGTRGESYKREVRKSVSRSKRRGKAKSRADRTFTYVRNR